MAFSRPVRYLQHFGLSFPGMHRARNGRLVACLMRKCGQCGGTALRGGSSPRLKSVSCTTCQHSFYLIAVFAAQQVSTNSPAETHAGVQLSAPNSTLYLTLTPFTLPYGFQNISWCFKWSTFTVHY